MVVMWGVVAVGIAAFLGGLTGFGYSLIATPLLLTLGLHPAAAVTINLTIALITRVAVTVRLRSYVRWRRALSLTIGSVPGLLLGAVVGDVLDPSAVRVVAGVLVLVVAPILMVRQPKPGNKPLSRYAFAGFVGGVLGTSTSLNGVPAAVMLSADQQDQRSFIADLAVFFVFGNALSLIVLSVRDGIDPSNLRLLAWWLPGALVANVLGTSLAPRINSEVFRVITCVLVMAAGVATLVSA